MQYIYFTRTAIKFLNKNLFFILDQNNFKKYKLTDSNFL